VSHGCVHGCVHPWVVLNLEEEEEAVDLDLNLVQLCIMWQRMAQERRYGSTLSHEGRERAMHESSTVFECWHALLHSTL
jgi:hypothetical protein